MEVTRVPDSHNKQDKDEAYQRWKARVAFLSTVSNYSAMFFLVLHPLLMIVAYDFWANYHLLMLTHSGQQVLLGLFIWAIPDVKYQYWIKNKLWIYYLLSFFNIMFVLFGLVVSSYFYCMGPALYSFLSAALAVYLLLGTGPLIVAIISSFILILTVFYEKPTLLEYHRL